MGELTPTALLRSFFATALPLLAAAAIAAVVTAAGGDNDARWVALHLALLGCASQLIVGVAQFFVCAFLATTPPPRRLIHAQLLAWNLAVICVVLSGPLGSGSLATLGAVAVLAGLGLFFAGLNEMRAKSLQHAPWALRWYVAGGVALGVGAAIGAAVANGAFVVGGSLIGAHAALNVAGWIGTAIVGTLHTFVPTLTGTRLALPRLQSLTFAAWVGSCWLLAGGLALGSEPVGAAALLGLAAASGLVAVNSSVAVRRRTIRLSAAAWAVLAGEAALVAALAVAVVDAVAAGASTLDALLSAAPLFAAWIALTIAGSLRHLLGVLAHVRRLHRGNPLFG